MGLHLDSHEIMQRTLDYVRELDSKLPEDFQLQYTNECLTFKQEILQKLKAIGLDDSVLINVPEVQSEYNEDALKFELQKWQVWGGFVPPGRHSIVIKPPQREAQKQS